MPTLRARVALAATLLLATAIAVLATAPSAHAAAAPWTFTQAWASYSLPGTSTDNVLSVDCPSSYIPVSGGLVDDGQGSDFVTDGITRSREFYDMYPGGGLRMYVDSRSDGARQVQLTVLCGYYADMPGIVERASTIAPVKGVVDDTR